MMKYKCLVLDHDDTAVASEASINYPCFLLVLDRFRPGMPHMDLDTFTRWCFDPGFAGVMRQYYHFNDQEMQDEFQMWLDYVKEHIPPAYPGMKEIILEQKRQGGYVCVVSHSGRENILRDYRHHFGIEPDMIFSWEDPEEQRKPSTYPLEKIMETYGLTPADLLVVDDLKPGCDMAKNTGVEIAYAGWGRKNVPEIGQLMRSWCDYSFDATGELHEFLFRDV